MLSLRCRVIPAPLDLCYVSHFDLRRDLTVCPPERNVLSNFYVSAKGGEWTDSKNWMDLQNNHCLWHGVTCDNGAVSELNLHSDGLSGTLDKGISELRSLEVLNLSDNDIKVYVGYVSHFRVLLCVFLMPPHHAFIFI